MPRGTKRSTKSKLRQQCELHSDLLMSGRVLAIDPSIGSTASSMGYALYVAGALEDAGIIQIPSELSTPMKLQQISRVLLEDFNEVDVLVVENIAPSRGGPGSRAFINKSWKTLHQATGAAIASVRCSQVVEVAPISWKRFAKVEDGYIKSDVADAVMIGYTALWEAADHLGVEPPIKHYLKPNEEI